MPMAFFMCGVCAAGDDADPASPMQASHRGGDAAPSISKPTIMRRAARLLIAKHARRR